MSRPGKRVLGFSGFPQFRDFGWSTTYLETPSKCTEKVLVLQMALEITLEVQPLPLKGGYYPWTLVSRAYNSGIIFI